MEKMNKREKFGVVVELINNMENVGTKMSKTDILEFLNNEIDILERKANSPRTKKVNEEDTNYMTTIENILKNAKTDFTIKEIQLNDNNLLILSTSKMTSLLGKLIDKGVVTRIKVGKKVSFKYDGVEE